MSSNELPHKGVAAALAAFPLTGIFGIDKLYSGTSRSWWIQLVLSLTILGLIVSWPWAFASWIVLVFAILYGSNAVHSTLYPGVEWAPITSTDKLIAYIIIVIWIISFIVGITRRRSIKEGYKNFKKNKYREMFTTKCSNCNKYQKCKCL